MMDIRPNVLFNACVAGVAALLVGCGGSQATADPFAPAPVQAQTLATQLQTTNRPLTMIGKFWEGGHGGPAMVSVAVDSIAACQRAAMETTYIAKADGAIRASCLGTDGIPVARFICNASAHAVNCVPTRSF